MAADYLDIHTHSSRQSGRYVMNIFAQELDDSFSPNTPCTIGLHPWHLLDVDCSKAMNQLEKFAHHPMVVGIGECGLDKNIQLDVSFQKNIFLQQLELADKIQKPAIIHCVKAYSEMLYIRKTKKWNQPWLFHWFNASKEMAADLILSGCYLSFGRSLLQQQGKNQDVFKTVPLEFVFFETDDAEITIESVYEKAAEIKNISVYELTKSININYKKLFANETIQ